MRVIHFSFFFLTSVTICLIDISCTETPDQTADGNLKQLAVANNEFGLNIFQKLALQSSENVFISPLSLSAAFGMLYYGAKGETAKELRQILGYESAQLPTELVHTTFQHYLTQILPSQDTNTYALSAANAAFLAKRLGIYPSYKKEIQDYYQAMIEDVDFMLENKEIVEKINEWVNDKTNGMINKLLDSLHPSTVFVLLNAVYFKGAWKTKFETSKTEPQKFYNKGLLSEVKEVPMMRLVGKFPYMMNSEFEAIEMPYKGGNISMIVLLPHERDGLESLEKNLSLEKFKNIQLEFDKTKINLRFPKFKMEYFKEMSRNFAELGANSIFSPGANFSGITESKGIYVSQILHKAVIDVNEEGSEAAAVTGIIAVRMSHVFDHPTEMVVDHPFLFVIVDKRNDMILFIGHVTDL